MSLLVCGPKINNKRVNRYIERIISKIIILYGDDFPCYVSILYVSRNLLHFLSCKNDKQDRNCRKLSSSWYFRQLIRVPP